MIIVADAGVSIKWFVPEIEAEEGSYQAIELLKQAGAGAIEPFQPPHWQQEVIAVISRIRPDIAEQAIDYLTAMDIQIEQDADVLKIAARLSGQLNHHLFDTYYHALAIFYDGVFITADKVYYGKAESLGKIKRLKAWKDKASKG